MLHTLVADDVELARIAAQARFERRAASPHRWGYSQAQHSVDVEANAIGGEIAVARVLGLLWRDSSVPTNEGDLGPGIHVRQTTYVTGRLLLHPEDDDQHRFILVRGTLPNYTVAGWVFAREGKHRLWWRDLSGYGRYCYVVPNECLRLIETFETSRVRRVHWSKTLMKWVEA